MNLALLNVPAAPFKRLVALVGRPVGFFLRILSGQLVSLRLVLLK